MKTKIVWFQVKRKDRDEEEFHSPIKGHFSTPEKAWAFYCKNQEKYSWLDKRIKVQELREGKAKTLEVILIKNEQILSQ